MRTHIKNLKGKSDITLTFDTGEMEALQITDSSIASDLVAVQTKAGWLHLPEWFQVDVDDPIVTTLTRKGFKEADAEKAVQTLREAGWL